MSEMVFKSIVMITHVLTNVNKKQKQQKQQQQQQQQQQQNKRM